MPVKGVAYTDGDTVPVYAAVADASVYNPVVDDQIILLFDAALAVIITLSIFHLNAPKVNPLILKAK